MDSYSIPLFTDSDLIGIDDAKDTDVQEGFQSYTELIVEDSELPILDNEKDELLESKEMIQKSDELSSTLYLILKE